MSDFPARRRILHLLHHPGSGGTEQYVASLCRGLDPDKYALYFGHTDQGPLVNVMHQLGAQVFHVSMRRPFDLTAVRVVARLMRTHRIDVVHTHFLRENFIAILAAKLAGVPAVVNTVHMIEPKSGPVARINRWMTRGCDRTIAVSNAVRTLLLGEGQPPDRVVTIYNGVDAGRFGQRQSAALRAEIEADADTVVIGTVGRLSHEKGHADLVQAAARLVRAGRNVRFAIVGDGPMAQELRALADSLGIAGYVRWLGYRMDMPDVLGAMDIFAMPSHSEALGIAILEAMAARLPVVATSVGGIPEIVHAGETGLLVPPHQPEALATALEQLIDEPLRRKAMADAARAEVEKRFDLAVMVSKTTALYEEILARRH